MSTRRRVFFSHSFSHCDKYAGALRLMERHGYEYYNHSIPAWSPVDADDDELEAVIIDRISRSSTVLVLATEELHKSRWVNFELYVAAALGKRIIGIKPMGEFNRPIPQMLNDNMYRLVGWRGESIVRALEGQYRPDSRVFNIAEEADRESLVSQVAFGGSVVSLLMLGSAPMWMPALRELLASRSIKVNLDSERNTSSFQDDALKSALVGGLIGMVAGGLAGGSAKAACVGALGGAALGVGWTALKHYWISMQEMGPLTEVRFVADGHSQAALPKEDPLFLPAPIVPIPSIPTHSTPCFDDVESERIPARR